MPSAALLSAATPRSCLCRPSKTLLAAWACTTIPTTCVVSSTPSPPRGCTGRWAEHRSRCSASHSTSQALPALPLHCPLFTVLRTSPKSTPTLSQRRARPTTRARATCPQARARASWATLTAKARWLRLQGMRCTGASSIMTGSSRRLCLLHQRITTSPIRNSTATTIHRRRQLRGTTQMDLWRHQKMINTARGSSSSARRRRLRRMTRATWRQRRRMRTIWQLTHLRRH
mmetsp:Transcript_82690/g.177180  ORF Transcript_82690/g.177180 Transcript_82690/m.177180 type:complete len:230 (-) Transcript_82690:507-1196(-)